MSAVETILIIGVPAVLAVLAVPARGLAVGKWHGHRRPPTRRDPDRMSRALAADRECPMETSAHRYTADAVVADTVRIGRVRDVLRHGDPDAGGTWITMTLDLPDGSTTELRHDTTAARAEHARIGALVPVVTGRGGRSMVAGDARIVRAALLDHKLGQGLIDEVEHRVLSTGRCGVATVESWNPTGFVRRGSIEVTVHFVTADGSRARVTGFLRPQEMAAVQRTGTVPVSSDRSGQWALGPTWY